MFSTALFAASYGFAAAVQPGQLQAYLVSRAIAHGWRRTLPAVLAPLLSDVPVILLVVLLLTRVPPLFLNVLRVVGGVFLLYLAYGALRASRGEAGTAASPAAAHRTFLEAVLINLLNPSPYLGWALVLGPLLLQSWASSAASGIAVLAAFYLSLIAGSSAIVILFAQARALGPRVARGLVALSALALAAFGAWQLWAGLAAFR